MPAVAGGQASTRRSLRLARRLGVGGRIATLGLSVVLLATICLSVALSGIVSARADSREARRAAAGARLAEHALTGWQLSVDQSVAAFAATAGGAPTATVAADWRRAELGYRLTTAQLSLLNVAAPTAAARSAARRAAGALVAYYRRTAELRQLVATGGSTHAMQTAQVARDAAVARADTTFSVLEREPSLNPVGAAARSYAALNGTLALVLALAFAALAGAVAVTLAVARSITRPLGRVTNAAKQLAQGHVDVEIGVDSDDQIGQIAKAFEGTISYRQKMSAAARELAAGNLAVDITPRSHDDRLAVAFAAMRTKIVTLMSEISDSSRTVGAASAQIARGGEQTGMSVSEIAHAVGSVAQGAEIQVRSLTQALSVTEEVATASQASAAEAQETATAARETRAAADDGAAAVRRATEVMQAIKVSSADITSTIHGLGEASEQIGSIVDTIAAVTKQTNLLALNAAIEAARAGEHGRGFAVVAEHVRELAEQSQRAAASISDLIGKIQAETGVAVQVVLEGARHTDEGVATVERARAAFSRIDASVADMNGRVERIASSIEHIATSGARMQESLDEVLAVAEQSSASAEQVSATAQHTSATTQEIAASAHALAGTAHELERLATAFTLA